MATWKVAEVKSRLSELIDRAMREGAQEITRHGGRAVVVVSAQEWDRKTRRKEGLVQFLDRSPAARLWPGGRALAGPGVRRRAVSYLLDTNVISEWTRPRPDAGVVAWLATADEDNLYLSVLASRKSASGSSACRRARSGTGSPPGSTRSLRNASKAGSSPLIGA
jgi:prevent-host-death family protein